MTDIPDSQTRWCSTGFRHQLKFLLCIVSLAAGCSGSPGAKSSVAESLTDSTDETVDPQELLKKLYATYQDAKSYSDNSSVVFYAVQRASGSEKEIPFTRISVALDRPNRLYLTYKKNISSPDEESYELACDGRIVRSTANETPDQVHEAIAPAELSAENFIPEPELRRAILESSIENTLPQLALLLSKGDQQSAVFPNADEARALRSAVLDGATYQRVEIPTPFGKRVLWIEPENFTLRRMELPIDNQRELLNVGNAWSDIAVWVDFEDVTLDANIKDETFAITVPEGARRVRRFVAPPPAGPPEFLGKPVGQFTFTSLRGEDVTPESLGGRVTILDFWSTGCPHCRMQTPVLNEVYQHFESNEDVSFLAVSTDDRDVTNEAAERTLRSWGGEMTFVRDLKSSAYHELNLRTLPTLILVDGEGRLQSFQVGPHRRSEPLIDAVQRLVDGENIVATDRAKHAEFLVKYEQALDAAEIKDSILDVEVFPPEIGSRSLPKQLQLKQLWQTSADQLARPGDVQILAHESWGPSVRLIALDGGQAVVELNCRTGEVLGRHQLPEHDEQAGGFLRTWSNAEGETWYLASGVGWQQVYVLDNSWEHVLSFPDEPHSGIGDVLFDDLTGTGTPVMYIGYWGGLGIQGGTLDARRLWSNRRLDHVLQIGYGPNVKIRDDNGDREARTTWGTSTRGTLTQMGATGKNIRERYVEGQALMYFASGPSEDRHCGLSLDKAGQYTAAGFNDLGQVAWEYPLPAGDYVEPLSRIHRVQLPGSTPAWLVVAANGSLHWLDDSGQLIDRFDYGEILTGVSMNTVGEQTLLFVSTAEQLTAWQVELPSQPSDTAPQREQNELVGLESSESGESAQTDPAEADAP